MSHLALGLSKRLSMSTSSPSQKRRSVSLNLSNNTSTGRGPRTSQVSASQVSTPNTPSDLASEDGNVTSRTASPSAASLRAALKDQESEIDRLNAHVSDLRDELLARPTEDELESMRKEWETSEELFARSQQDNEVKHATIEHLRQYIKGLEHKLEEMLGDGWRDCCPNLPPAQPSSTSFASTTPLPRPGANVNTSRTSKRASRSSRGGSAFEAARLRELRDLGSACEKTNPAAALRKLEGINEGDMSRRSTQSNSSTADAMEVDGLVDASFGPKSRPGSFDGHGHSPNPTSTASPAPLPLPPTPTPAAPAVKPSAARIADQLATLTSLVKLLPATLERARVDVQKAAMLEMLDAAELRAGAREIRLQGMLAEAKACSGQMGW